MADRIVEGLWDCPYCGTKAIGGLTKSCPCCGHPQDSGTKFYLGKKKKYLEASLSAQYGQGPDWICPYCGSLNRIRFKYCSGCGAPKDSSEDDYFSIKARAEQASSGSSNGNTNGNVLENGHDKAGGKENRKADRKAREEARAADRERRKAAFKKRLPFILAGLLAFFAILLFIFWPRNYKAEVSGTAWAREIDIEAYRTVQESDWTVPSGGRVYDEKTEIHHYRDVLDHYVTRTRQVSEQVYDGEDTHTSYTDNGDGTFTESTYSTPRYRTEYHTETYEEPVYRSEPVYATKYYYDIDKWIVDREEKSEGADNEPYWPEYTLAENERTGYIGEAYILAVRVKDKVYRTSLPLEWWEPFHKGDKVEVTVQAGKITKVNGQEVE